MDENESDGKTLTGGVARAALCVNCAQNYR